MGFLLFSFTIPRVMPFHGPDALEVLLGSWRAVT
jgi:hypothetical protein